MAIDHSDKHPTAADDVRADTEHLRRVAEDNRAVVEAHRQQEETRRETGERRRESAETARTTAEGERAAAERIRHDAMVTLGTTAEALHLALQHMKVVEELRRALRNTPHPIVHTRIDA